jgi:hypothetical protein
MLGQQAGRLGQRHLGRGDREIRTARAWIKALSVSADEAADGEQLVPVVDFAFVVNCPGELEVLAQQLSPSAIGNAPTTLSSDADDHAAPD